MSTAILGISAFYHDSAAALIVDGNIIAAVQEERFTRIKHDAAFPAQSIDYCLREAGITASDLDHVVFYEKPLLKFERLLETYLATAPMSFRSFLKAMPVWFHQKLHLTREMSRGLKGYGNRFVFVEHHQSHAASAFYPSPFEEAAILTVDGVGEWATASLACGFKHEITLQQQMIFPHSLGLLYSAFTYYCGFKVNSGEYKLMGLAPYGDPRFADDILGKLMDLREDGSFRLDLSYFNYCHGLTMTSKKFHSLFGASPRKPEMPLTDLQLDLAASIQKVTETVMLRMSRHLHAKTRLKNLCLAGGVALNCVANGRLLRESPFEHLWIQPASGDAGGALGAALFVWHQLAGKPRSPKVPDSQKGSLLGPSYSREESETTLKSVGAIYQEVADDDLYTKVADLLGEGKVVGWVQGRMEFGPRGLGSRSILGDARNPEMQKVMNLKIKFRESFRPFAPIVLRKQASEYFEMRPEDESPYMLIVANLREDKLVPNHNIPGAGLNRVNQVRSVVPAVTHVDNSARVQTVDEERQPRLYHLLEAFSRQYGSPVLINTSFNIRGEPIICTPEDAYRCFMATGMDVLVLGSFILLKEQQRQSAVVDKQAYLTRFGQD